MTARKTLFCLTEYKSNSMDMRVLSRGQNFENKVAWLQNVYMQKAYNVKYLLRKMPTQHFT